MTFLVACGYNELETDVAELQEVGDEVPIQQRQEEMRAANHAAWDAMDEADGLTRIKLMRARNFSHE